MNRIRSPIWIIPLAVAAGVAVFGWWADNRLRQTVEQQLHSELNTTLNANVTSLEIWMTNQIKHATSLADEPEVHRLALRILDESDQPPTGEKTAVRNSDAEKLSEYLRDRLTSIRYGFAQIVNTNLAIVHPARGPRAIQEDHIEKFSELFSSGRPVIITPFKTPVFNPGPWRGGGGRGLANGSRASRDRGTNGPPQPERRGREQGTNEPLRPPAFRPTRGTNGFVPFARPPSAMQVAAPIRDDRSILRGALALIINPDEEFSQILAGARAGNSGETYAFDQHGLLISKSRFEGQLGALGLIGTNVSSALNLHLTEPGADPVITTNAASAPLIRIVGNAINGNPGVDVKPFRDYRGVLVVGASRWLPQHGFGVATQLDADEAYQPLHVLRRLFVTLFALLMLSAAGMFLFSYVNAISRRRLTEAEIKLKQLGQYSLEEKIGEGGMGVVYRARHALMRRETAVKLLLPDRADAASIQRFEREVCLTCQLTHPNTIQVYDYGRTPEGIFYYAMEFLRGLNLHDLVGRFGAQPEGRVIHILAQICDSLAEAHALGLVHRDIKPANVFLCNRGGVPDCVKVLDFGLVREYRGLNRGQTPLTAELDLIGTPSSMAPEALKNSTRSDPRSDIYAIGALAYHLLTGRDAFEADSVVELYNLQMTVQPIPPSQRTSHPVSAKLEETIRLCLDKDPDVRPQSVEALRALLMGSPRAADWTPEARLAWWAEYAQRQESQKAALGAPPPSPMDATVKIDFSNRII